MGFLVLESQVTTEIDLKLKEPWVFEGSGEMVYRSYRVYFQGEPDIFDCLQIERPMPPDLGEAAGRVVHGEP